MSISIPFVHGLIIIIKFLVSCKFLLIFCVCILIYICVSILSKLCHKCLLQKMLRYTREKKIQTSNPSCWYFSNPLCSYIWYVAEERHLDNKVLVKAASEITAFLFILQLAVTVRFPKDKAALWNNQWGGKIYFSGAFQKHVLWVHIPFGWSAATFKHR